MYYMGTFIGDIPENILLGNMTFTNLKYVCSLLNKVNKGIFNSDLGLSLMKVEGTHQFEWSSKVIDYPNGSYLLKDNFGFCVNWSTNKGHLRNSIYTTQPWVFYRALEEIYYDIKYRLESLLNPNIMIDSLYAEKVQLYYNQLNFVFTWLARSVDDDNPYNGEISYDNGLVWVHPHDKSGVC